MREVFIISTGEIHRGRTAGARRILNIARSLAAGNTDVYLCSLSGFAGRKYHLEEISKRIYALEPDNKKNSGHSNLIGFLRAVNSLLNRNESDKVIYLYPSTFVFRDFIYLVCFKYLKGIKFFCEINELRSAIAFSSSPPHGIISGLIYYLKSVKDYMVYRLNELQVGLYDGIIVISTGLKDYFSGSARRITRIPILCDADQIDLRKEPARFDGPVFKICFAGYIKAEKEGFDLLFDALSSVNVIQPVELYLYGIFSDEDERKISEYKTRYGLSDRIFYMGNIDPEKLQNEFNNYHLLILPRPLNRRTRFGFSTKLSEYLVSGRPVLLTEVSDNALFIRDGYNGFIIPPGDVAAMSGKLMDIIGHYNELVPGIISNAYKTVREELDYRNFTRQYTGFLFDDANRPEHEVEGS